MKQAALDIDKPKIRESDVMIRALALEAGIRGFAFACWQKPESDQRHIIIDCQETPHKGKIELEESQAGFIVGPFHNPELEETQFLQADIYFKTGMIAPEVSGQIPYERQQKAHQLLQAIESNANHQKSNPFHLNSYQAVQCDETNFKRLVAHSVENIKAGQMLKVVPSRVKDVPLSEFTDILNVFYKVHDIYPSAFASLVSLPEKGTWLGASPEPLIQLKGARYFSTVALAGTQRAEADTDLADVAWTQKEIEEQALVSRYIINCFKKIRLREFEEQGPRTIRAGNLIHLLTNFKVDMQQVNFPQLGSVMLQLLHPTSAVCGMPLEMSKAFLLENENYDRSLYSGFLGPINIDNTTDIYVNLRCMQFFENQVRIYAGAGVTEHSNPDKEWMETEYKCQTMLNLLSRNL